MDIILWIQTYFLFLHYSVFDILKKNKIGIQIHVYDSYTDAMMCHNVKSLCLRQGGACAITTIRLLETRIPAWHRCVQRSMFSGKLRAILCHGTGRVSVHECDPDHKLLIGVNRDRHQSEAYDPWRILCYRFVNSDWNWTAAWLSVQLLTLCEVIGSYCGVLPYQVRQYNIEKNRLVNHRAYCKKETSHDIRVNPDVNIEWFFILYEIHKTSAQCWYSVGKWQIHIRLTSRVCWASVTMVHICCKLEKPACITTCPIPLDPGASLQTNTPQIWYNMIFLKSTKHHWTR